MSRYRIEIDVIHTWVIDVDARGELQARDAAKLMICGRRPDIASFEYSAYPMPELTDPEPNTNRDES